MGVVFLFGVFQWCPPALSEVKHGQTSGRVVVMCFHLWKGPIRQTPWERNGFAARSPNGRIAEKGPNPLVSPGTEPRDLLPGPWAKNR